MSWLRTISSVGIAVLMCAPVTAGAQGRGRGHDQSQRNKAEKPVATSGRAATVHPDHHIDRDGHVRVIREYAHAGSLPPGLAKREALPPGLRKQLHERGTLPPGLQKRLVAVPAPLIARLPPVPGYYHRYFAGDDLLIVDARTNRIAAIVPGVWR